MWECIPKLAAPVKPELYPSSDRGCLLNLRRLNRYPPGPGCASPNLKNDSFVAEASRCVKDLFPIIFGKCVNEIVFYTGPDHKLARRLADHWPC